MTRKEYAWTEGAVLEEHSRRKHKILREYFHSYIVTRCQLPQQTKFRVAIVDGFSGAGRYADGSPGSPLIFIEELCASLLEVNTKRTIQDLQAIEVECLLVLNDAEPQAIGLLKENIAPLQAGLVAETNKLHLRIDYLSDDFENAYPTIKKMLDAGRYRNVLFNLDQCGHSKIEHKTLLNIMHTYNSVEVFYTFAIEALIAFLSNSDPQLLARQLNHLRLSTSDLSQLEGEMRKDTWLAVAEQIVFGAFKTRAPFVSPFSINNPSGWRYWFVHFANSYRARQVYNNILHKNSGAQAHYGRSGLHMLSYDPSTEGMLYLFNDTGRTVAKEQLFNDIPKVIAESGDAMVVGEFYEDIYNFTPAHADDINSALIDNLDIEVITPDGGKRRSTNTISVQDVIRLKNQRSFFPIFGHLPPRRS